MSAYFTARSNIVRDELERPDYSPITDDTPKMFALKESFRRSGLTSEHFDIDPFRYNSMSAWYQGVMKERGLIVDNPAASIASTKPSCGNAPDEDQDFFSRSGDSAVDRKYPPMDSCLYLTNCSLYSHYLRPKPISRCSSIRRSHHSRQQRNYRNQTRSHHPLLLRLDHHRSSPHRLCSHRLQLPRASLRVCC